MNSDPCARKDRCQAAPDNVPDAPTLAKLATRFIVLVKNGELCRRAVHLKRTRDKKWGDHGFIGVQRMFGES